MATLMRRTTDPLSRFLEDFMDGGMPERYSSSLSMPAVNVMERDDEFMIEVAAPGYKKDDFKLSIDQNVLTISSEKQEKAEDDKVSRREFSYASFQRSFTLPTSVDADKVDARYEDGILNIHLPKKEEAKAKPKRTIDIS